MVSSLYTAQHVVRLILAVTIFLASLFVALRRVFPFSQRRVFFIREPNKRTKMLMECLVVAPVKIIGASFEVPMIVRDANPMKTWPLNMFINTYLTIKTRSFPTCCVLDLVYKHEVTIIMGTITLACRL